MCVGRADLHGFYLEAEGEKAGKSLHTYANQLDEIMTGGTGCGRSFASHGQHRNQKILITNDSSRALQQNQQ